MPKGRLAPTPCRRKDNPVIVKIFGLYKDEEPTDPAYERVPEKKSDRLDQYYTGGKNESQTVSNRR